MARRENGHHGRVHDEDDEHPVRIRDEDVEYGDPEPPAPAPTKVKPLISAGANFTLLGGKFMAAFEKRENGYSILVTPTDAESKGMRINEIISEINALISGTGAALEAKDIEDKLKEVSEASADPKRPTKFDITSLLIRLRQVFLYYQSTDAKKLEYAFSLEIDASDCFGTSLGIVGLDNVFFSIWNTKREKVLERMKIVDINSYPL